MARHGDEYLVPHEADLVFRNLDRAIPQKKVNAVQVCPVEDGVERQVHFDCSRCGIHPLKARGAHWLFACPVKTGMVRHV